MRTINSNHRGQLRAHAIARFRVRCGVVLPEPEYDRMVALIARGGVRPAAFTQGGGFVYHVRYGGVGAYAIWSQRAPLIATFYPTLDWVFDRGGYTAADLHRGRRRAQAMVGA